MTRSAALLLAAAVAACTHSATLTYAPSPSYGAATDAALTNTVASVQATDSRGEADPTWIGAVRGGFGNPIKVLHTPQPLATVVQQAFADALRRRGWLAQGAGRYVLQVDIRRFQVSQYERREADIDLLVRVTDVSGGREAWHDEVAVNPVSGSVIALDVGVFGSADDLQAVAQSAMNQAIDMVLDKPGLAAALRT